MGTGTFIDVNTGSYPHASVAGLYPLVGWKIGPEIVYLAEGNATGSGTAMEWALKMGKHISCIYGGLSVDPFWHSSAKRFPVPSFCKIL